MSQETRVTSLGELLNYVLGIGAARIHVALPARVESYDSVKQVVSVQPLTKEVSQDESGSPLVESLPIVNNVPVVFPGAGGYQLRFPVTVGDEVLLIFTDRSIDQWKSQGGEVDPIDLRRHNLTDAIAIPGLHNLTQNKLQAIDVISDGTVKLGSGAAQFVALANIVNSAFSSLVTTFNAHVHTGVTTGAGTSAVPATPMTGFSDVSATKVKAI